MGGGLAELVRALSTLLTCIQPRNSINSTGCFSLMVDSGSYPNEISWYVYSRGDGAAVVAEGGGGQTEEVCNIPTGSTGDECEKDDCYGYTCDHWNNIYGLDPNQCDWTAGWDYAMDMCDCSGCDCDKHDSTCPTGFTMSETGSCYWLSEDEHSFTACQDYACSVMGGTLASYSSAEEFAYLQVCVQGKSPPRLRHFTSLAPNSLRIAPPPRPPIPTQSITPQPALSHTGQVRRSVRVGWCIRGRFRRVW